MALYGAEIWTLRKVNQKYRNTWKGLKCGAGEGWRRSVGPILWEMKKCYIESERREYPAYSKRRTVNWIGHVLRRNCLLKHAVEGKMDGTIEGTEGQWKRHKQLLDDVKKTRGYCKLKGEALYCALWRTGFGSGYGPVVRHTAEWINE